MELTGTEHLERAVTELGEPEALFRVGGGRFLAKLALGVLLVAYGAVANYFWWVGGPARFDHLTFLLLVVPPLSGVSLLAHMYRNRGLFVLVYPAGLLRLRSGEVDSLPWDEVESVKLRVQRAEDAEFAHDPDGHLVACWLPPDVPTFKLWSAGLTVTRGDGVAVEFGPALSDYDRLAVEVQRRTFAALWPAVRARFRAGDTLAFGELEVGAVGLMHAGKRLRWRELKELAVAQGKLSVKQVGKWLPWALIDVGDVPNPHLLFALADEARRTLTLPSDEPNPPPGGQRESEVRGEE
jgi:hypothetical protein